MRRSFILLLACLAFPQLSQASATLTLIVKTSYSSTIKIEARSRITSRSETLWQSAVNGDTTLIATLQPSGISTYVIQDANHLLGEWTLLANGDSLVYTVDLDSGTAELSYDK